MADVITQETHSEDKNKFLRASESTDGVVNGCKNSYRGETENERTHTRELYKEAKLQTSRIKLHKDLHTSKK